MRSITPPPLFGHDVAAVHCVGVGGMGLGPLAIYLAAVGFAVSGEDDAMTELMRAQLVRAGVTLTGAGAVPAVCRLVACSSAIRPAHPAVVAAQARGLRIVRRGELLAEVTKAVRLVAVCGSHGKTTTAAMLVARLRAVNFPAGYILGGLFADEAIAPAAAGSNGWVVAEVDESDGTIDCFAPELTLCVNLDWDHPDRYQRLAELEATFAALFARTRGWVLVNGACALSARLAPAEARTFGRAGHFQAGWTAEAAGRIRLQLGGLFPHAEAPVNACGDFNATNAVAAFAAAQLMGVKLAPHALERFPGVRRRQTVLHAANNLTVIEDYAHHPAEIRALLGSLRARIGPPKGRLVVVFQPHRFSRTAQFLTEFAAALVQGDAVFLIDVYGAGEAPLAGGTSADLYADLQRVAPALPVTYLPGDADGTLAALARARRPGDLVVFVGAGNIDRMARHWLGIVVAQEGLSTGWDAHAAVLGRVLSAATTIRREEPLARKTTMGVGGAARLYAEPADEADLTALVRGARLRGVPIVMLGRGSNLIVPDEGVDALVISLRQPAWETFERCADGRVWAGAGLRLKNLCGLAVRAGLAGFEFLEGVPGNLGGALRMNAGAMGGWIYDVVEEVRVLTFDGEARILKKSELHVAYRHCAELHDAVALGAWLRPTAQAGSADVARQVDAYRDRRQKTQPREPSAGCIFKNPPGDSAGRLIDVSGLKGERVGEAEVSAVHANFIVNRGAATAADVIALVRRVRGCVEQAHGVRLEPEALLCGKNWEDVL